MDDAPVFPFSKLSKIQDKLLYVYFSVRSNYKSFLGCYCKGFEMNHWTLISATMVKWYTMVFPWYCQNSKSVNVNRLFLSKTLVWPKENMWCLLCPREIKGKNYKRATEAKLISFRCIAAMESRGPKVSGALFIHGKEWKIGVFHSKAAKTLPK